MAFFPLTGWITGLPGLGDKKVVVGQWTGPASYTAITPGTPPAAPTGGDSVTAVACGLKFIEAIIVGGDSAGKYAGWAFNPAVNKTGSPAGQGAAATSVPLQWIVSATGAEATGNLSAAQLTLVVIGF